MSEKEALFWDLVEPLLAEPGVEESTMMGFPCVRVDGQFFASIDHRSHDLIVKVSQERVGEVIESGVGSPFAPAGRVFREWVALKEPDEATWRSMIAEAKSFVSGG